MSRVKNFVDDAFPESDREAWAVIGVILTVLFGVEYLGFWPEQNWLDFGPFPELRSGPNNHFADKMYFSISRIVIYLVPPLLFTKFVLQKPLSHIGWSLKVDRAHLLPYVGLYFAVLPFVLWAASRGEFQNYYPFFKPLGFEPAWRFFAVWELSYLLYFIAFEFFFRGFVLQALRPRFGTMAVALMLIPYVMIHFRKPALEALGAVVAGLVLGVMAYRSRSAFPGALLHYAVALTMDLLTVEGL